MLFNDPNLMNRDEIINYIKRTLQLGLDPEKIKSNLLIAGHKEIEIDKAFTFLNKEPNNQPQPQTLTPPLPQTSAATQAFPQLPPLPSFQQLQPPSSPLAFSLTNSLGETIANPLVYPSMDNFDQPKSNNDNQDSFQPEGGNPLPFLSFSYYRNILLGAKKISIFLILLIISFFNCAKPTYDLFIFGIPLVTNFQNKIEKIINDIYPEKLEVKIKDGRATTNVSEPFYINIPKETISILSSSDKKNNLPSAKIRFLAIDTKAKQEDFEKYQVYALLTADSLIYYSSDKINIQSLKNIKDLTINKKIITTKFEELNNKYQISRYLKIILLVLPVFILMSFFIGELASSFFTSLLVLLLIKIKQLNFSFSKIFSYTVAISFIPAILFALLSSFSSLYLFAISESLALVIVLGITYSGIEKFRKTNHV